MNHTKATDAATTAVGDLTLPFTPEIEEQLLERIYAVQEWIATFAIALGGRNPPRIKTWITGHMSYAPLRNILRVPCKHLLTLSDQHLRLAVAHEMGHFSKRWPSLFSWTLFRRIEEELHADRCAVELTGASVGEWEDSIQAVATIEAPDARYDHDFIFQTRKQLLQRWVDRPQIS